MVDQTGWERTNVQPLSAVTPQEWAYMSTRNMINTMLSVSFRLLQRQLWIHPYALGTEQIPEGLHITFEYISRNWVVPGDQLDSYADKVVKASDIVLFEPYMFERLMKMRFLSARGFDTADAKQQFVDAFNSWAPKDSASPVLNAGQNRHGAHYLNHWRNTPETGYGLE